MVDEYLSWPWFTFLVSSDSVVATTSALDPGTSVHVELGVATCSALVGCSLRTNSPGEFPPEPYAAVARAGDSPGP
jgi:hypothetical protein